MQPPTACLVNIRKITKPFILATDASEGALGAILSQGTISNDKPVAYASRTLSYTESRYSTIERELLAVISAMKHFKPYLYGQKLVIYTDHRPLAWLYSVKEPNSKLIRWRLRLQKYDFVFIFKNGKQNINGDALSRIKFIAMETENTSVVLSVDSDKDDTSTLTADELPQPSDNSSTSTFPTEQHSTPDIQGTRERRASTTVYSGAT